MWRVVIVVLILAIAGTSCQLMGPAPWDGPVLSEPRTQLTVDQLRGSEVPPFLDTSFFAQPDWARDSTEPFSGSVSFTATEMIAPKERESYEYEDSLPEFTIEFTSHGRHLVPRNRGVIDPVGGSEIGRAHV